MTWLLPWMLGVGALAAAGVVALHLLARNRPPAWRLPTARFVPQAAVSSLTRSTRPRDRAVLAARLVAVLAIAGAAAAPRRTPSTPDEAGVVVADLSRTVADRRAVAESAAARAANGARLVALTDRPQPVTVAELRALADAPPPVRPARLSAAVLRAAAASPARSATTPLTLVSPLTQDVLDAAWPAVRATWPGATALVRVGGVTAPEAPALATRVRLPDDDPLAASLAALDLPRRADGLVVERTGPARDTLAAITISWPRAADDAGRDTALRAGLATAHVVFVSPLVALPLAVPATPHDTIARWLDGRPAAIEEPTARGCRRTIGVAVPTRGDAALQARWLAVVRDLLAPCGGWRDTTRVADRVVVSDAPTSRQAARATLTPAPSPWLVRALILLALVALVVEWRLRARREAA